MKHFLISLFMLFGSLTYAKSKHYNILPDTSLLHITIDSLKVGSRYLINLESIGCFHHSKLYLTISKNTDGYYATLKMEGKIEGRKIENKLKKTKLTTYQLDSVRNFEKQLLKISNQTFNCTTIDTYTFVSGATKNILKTDNCDWNGFGKLLAVIFKDKE